MPRRDPSILMALKHWREFDEHDRNHSVWPILRRMKRMRFPSPRVGPAEQERVLRRLATIPGALGLGNNYATEIATSYYPHFHRVVLRGKKVSIADAWGMDAYLRWAIEECFRSNLYPTPMQVRAKLRQKGEVGEVSNFRVQAARWLYQRYCPEGGTVLDPSAGWGSRQIAARSLGLRYIGTDPNTQTHECGLRLAADLDRVYEGQTKLHCIGSEEFEGEPGSVDVAFTSPPYFNLEDYSDEDTQSHRRYPELEQWFDGFVYPTAEMIGRVLKPGGTVILNVSEQLKTSFERVYECTGFELVEEHPYALPRIPGRTTRPGEVNSDNYFCRSATTTFAGSPPT